MAPRPAPPCYSRDTDYLATSGTLTFEPNETVLSILVPLINDLDPEAAESLTLTLSNPLPGAES